MNRFIIGLCLLVGGFVFGAFTVAHCPAFQKCPLFHCSNATASACTCNGHCPCCPACPGHISHDKCAKINICKCKGCHCAEGLKCTCEKCECKDCPGKKIP